MERTSVESSNLESIGYDEEEERLEVEFKGGGIYEYYAVPKSIHEQLIEASSIGSFFHYNVKKEFRFRKLA